MASCIEMFTRKLILYSLVSGVYYPFLIYQLEFLFFSVGEDLLYTRFIACCCKEAKQLEVIVGARFLRSSLFVYYCMQFNYIAVNANGMYTLTSSAFRLAKCCDQSEGVKVIR